MVINQICISATCTCENRKYLASIMDGLSIKCNEIKESYDEQTKRVSTNFNQKKTKFLYFICIFINYYNIIDSCQYLLLSDKISSKPKTRDTISRPK